MMTERSNPKGIQTTKKGFAKTLLMLAAIMMIAGVAMIGGFALPKRGSITVNAAIAPGPNKTTTWDFAGYVGASDTGSGPGWNWNGGTRTLTLTNFNFTWDIAGVVGDVFDGETIVNTPIEAVGAIRMPNNSTIRCSGTNSIINEGTDPASTSITYGIMHAGSLTINGTGDLNVECTGSVGNTSGAIYGRTASNSLVVAGNVLVNATGPETTAGGGLGGGVSSQSCGIMGDNIVVKDTAWVNATGGPTQGTDAHSIGLRRSSSTTFLNLTVSDNGRVVATGGTAANGNSYGFYGNSTEAALILDGGNLTAIGNTRAMSSNYIIGSYCPYGVSVNADGSSQTQGNTGGGSFEITSAYKYAAINSPPKVIGTVSIDGDPAYDETITANITGVTWNPNTMLTPNFHYSWYRGDTKIINKSSSPDYTCVFADIGKEITVEVGISSLIRSVTESVTVGKAIHTDTPSEAPSLASRTKTSITLNAISDCEYKVDGGEWQSGTFFDDLAASKEYTFYARFVETDTHKPSDTATSQAQISTLKATLDIVNDGTFKIIGNAVFGETLSVDISALTSDPEIDDLGTLSYIWWRSGIGSGPGAAIDGETHATYTLTIDDIGFRISVYVSAANCDGYVTPAKTTNVIKATQPEIPTLDYVVTNPTGPFPKTVTITLVEGAEYSFDGGDTWADSVGANVYESTEPEILELCIRMKETDTHFASDMATAHVDTTNQHQAPDAFTLQYEVIEVYVGGTFRFVYKVTIPATPGAEYCFVDSDDEYEYWSTTENVVLCMPDTTITGYKRMRATEGYLASESVSDTVTLPVLRAETPTATPNGGTFVGSVTVTFSCATSDAVIYYTINGTTLNEENAIVYTGALTLTATTTISVIAVRDKMEPSEILTFTITIIDYAVSNGADGEVKVDSNGGYTFTVNGDSAKFQSLKVGEVTLVKDTDYIVANGSTIITITKAGLEKLGTGTHEIKAHFTDGVVATTLKINPASSDGGPGDGGDEPGDEPGDGGDTTCPDCGKDPCECDDGDKDKDFPWALVGGIIGGVVLLGGGVALFFVLRKKKTV